MQVIECLEVCANVPLQLLMTGPKLVFSFWLAQTLIPAFDTAFKRQ